MGGHGSGRWKNYTKKYTVEDCLSLDANQWMKKGILKAGEVRTGFWDWTNQHTGAKIASNWRLNGAISTGKVSF